MNDLVTRAATHPLEPVRGHPGMTQRVFVRTPSLKVVQYFYATGLDGGAHAHGNDEQAVFCVSGKFEERLGDDVFVVAAGEGFRIPPGSSHGIRCLEAGSYLLITSPLPGTGGLLDPARPHG